MKAGIKATVKILAFVIALALLLYGINGILLPKYSLANAAFPATSTYRGFYAMKRDTVDVLFFGSSYGVNGFSPQEIYERYGIRSYNLSSEQQSPFLSYYWLKEALRYQHPSVVVMEGRFLRSWHPENPVNTTEGLIRKCLDPMRLSPVKAEAINSLCAVDGSQIKSSWYLTNIRFHDRWKSLNKTDFDQREDAGLLLKGWVPGNGGTLREYTPLANPGEGQAIELDSLMTEYFIKMSELCKQNGIRFIVINVPSAGFSAGIYYAYRNLCRENDVDYYELSEETEWNKLNIELPSENPVGHGNLRGNIKVSRYTGELLRDRYHVLPAADPQYEDSKQAYEHMKMSSRLKEVTNPDEYLSLLKDPDYMVFISVKEEASSALRESTKKSLQELGLKKEWDAETDFRKSYIGIITDEGITEETGEAIRAAGRFRNKNNSYEVTSIGYGKEGEPCSSIIIDGKEQSVNSRGLNIVVYDTVLRKVIDSVTFDTYSDSSAKRK